MYGSHVKTALLLLCMLISFWRNGIRATHFRGAHMWWTPIDGKPTQVRIGYSETWRRSYSGSTYCDEQTIKSRKAIGPVNVGYLMCDVGCSARIGEMTINCTDFSEPENWTTGVGQHVYEFPANDYYEVKWWGRGWLEDQCEDAEWVVRMVVNLRPRRDTGKVNTSPRASLATVVKLQQGCEFTLQIPVSDAEEDIVRCRWAQKRRDECGHVCSELDGAKLNKDDCSIKFGRYVALGKHALAIQVEDFAQENSVSPLSSVPLQFLVEIYDSNTTCSNRPEFLDPSPVHGRCILVRSGQNTSFTVAVRARNWQTEVSSLVTTSIAGLTKSRLTRYGDYTRDYYVNITWLPGFEELGERLFCFWANDVSGTKSVERCLTFNVTNSLPPAPSPKNMAYRSFAREISITFNDTIWYPPFAHYIRVYNQSGAEVVRINTADTNAVQIDDRKLSFRLPDDMTPSATYYVTIDKGALVGPDACGRDCLGVDNMTRFEFYYRPATPTSSPYTGQSHEYTWLIFVVVALVLFVSVIVILVVIVRRPTKKPNVNTQPPMPIPEWAERDWKEVTAEVVYTGPRKPNFYDIDVKFR